jgi:phosphate transport system protein
MANDLRAIIAMSKARASSSAWATGEEDRAHGARPRQPAGPPPRATRGIWRLAASLLRMSLDALTASICRSRRSHREGSRSRRGIAAGLRRLLTRAMEDPRNFDVTLEAAFVLKALERIGDHARNLGRHVQSIGQDAPAAQSLEPAHAASQATHSP